MVQKFYYFTILKKLGDTVSDGDEWEVENVQQSKLIWFWIWYYFLHTMLPPNHITDFPFALSHSIMATIKTKFSDLLKFIDLLMQLVVLTRDTMVFPLCCCRHVVPIWKKKKKNWFNSYSTAASLWQNYIGKYKAQICFTSSLMESSWKKHHWH